MIKLIIAISIITFLILGTTMTHSKNLKGKELTVKEHAIGCFSTGWIEKLRTCVKLGDWLSECKTLEKDLFQPISSTIDTPRCIKLEKGDIVKVIKIDTKDPNLIWIRTEKNIDFNWWTFRQFFTQ